MVALKLPALTDSNNQIGRRHGNYPKSWRYNDNDLPGRDEDRDTAQWNYNKDVAWRNDYNDIAGWQGNKDLSEGQRNNCWKWRGVGQYEH